MTDSFQQQPFKSSMGSGAVSNLEGKKIDPQGKKQLGCGHRDVWTIPWFGWGLNTGVKSLLDHLVNTINDLVAFQ